MRSEQVPVGSVAPPFELPSAGGETVRFPLAPAAPTVLLFYRGFWCGSCRQQLAALHQAHAAIDALRGRLVAVSSEPAAAVRAAVAEDPPPFLLLVDDRLTVIDRYGVRDDVPDEHGPIARPAVFLVDREGVVRFAHVAADPSDRPAVGGLLLALETIA